MKRLPRMPVVVDNTEQVASFGELLKYAFVPQFLMTSRRGDPKQDEEEAVAVFQVSALQCSFLCYSSSHHHWSFKDFKGLSNVRSKKLNRRLFKVMF